MSNTDKINITDNQSTQSRKYIRGLSEAEKAERLRKQKLEWYYRKVSTPEGRKQWNSDRNAYYHEHNTNKTSIKC
jgi:hypothetical protein